MTRIMYDGVNTDAPGIPVTAKLVAGYDDGLYKWSAADWARFPSSIHVHIAVFASTNSGVVLDVETGDATPAQSVDWVLMRRAAGADPTVYCNTSTWPLVRSAFAARGVAEPHYWVAQYDNTATIPAGAVAKQYADDVLLGKPYDLSVVADFWPGVDPDPGVDMVAWTDNITGPNGRPSGNTVADILTDLGRLRDALWGDPTALTAYPANSPLRQLLALAAANVEGELTTMEAQVGQLMSPAVDSAAVASALASDTQFVAAIAHALAVELHNITPAN